MGKAQSKRSVDITTEPKKGPEGEEVTGKVEKIEEADQKQVNGDATSPEQNECEKTESDESENDKDKTTEKSAETAQAGGGDNNEDQSNTTANTTADTESPKEDSVANKESAAGNASSTAEDVSPLADESSKKSKKEKVKKKWSFRSISFGKKDKQKPAKPEETTIAVENAAVITNGDGANALENPSAAEGGNKIKKDAEASSVADVEATSTAGEGNLSLKMENGDASEKEVNGQASPSPTEEKVAEAVANDKPTATSASATENEIAPENQTEKNETAVETSEISEAVVMSNDNGIEKDGTGSVLSPSSASNDEAMKDTITESVEIIDKIKSIPSVKNDGCDGENKTPHQNGTNVEIEVITKSVDNDEHLTTTTSTTLACYTATESLNISPTPSSSISPYDSQFHQSKTSAKNENNPEAKEEEETNQQYNHEFKVASIVDIESESVAPSIIPKTITNAPVSLFEPIATAEKEKQVQIPKSHETLAAVNTETNDERVKEESNSVESSKCYSQPPPLPISPPPSQVSVFAFNANNTETEEVSMVTSTQRIIATTTKTSENENTVVDPISVGQFVENVVSDNDDQVSNVISTGEQQEPVESKSDENKEIEVPIDTTLFENVKEKILKKEEEYIVATAVVADITDKAVQIVKQQKEQETEKEEKRQKTAVDLPSTSPQSQNDITKTEVAAELEKKDEVIVEKSFSASPKCKVVNAIQNDDCTLEHPTTYSVVDDKNKADIRIESDTADIGETETVNSEITTSENVINKDVLLIFPQEQIESKNEHENENINDGDGDRMNVDFGAGVGEGIIEIDEGRNQIVNETIEECALSFVKNEMNKLSLNDVAKDDDYINPVKDMANAKGSKENAEISTQDLTVSCE